MSALQQSQAREHPAPAGAQQLLVAPQRLFPQTSVPQQVSLLVHAAR
jgi:hypothetical protein